MKTFKDFLAGDVHRVFLNSEEVGEIKTIRYDGHEYANIPVVLTNLEERDRKQLQSDHVQGLYLVTAVLQCALTDLGGNLPEKGQRFRVSDSETGFFQEYYVASSSCEMGMLRVELEELDE